MAIVLSIVPEKMSLNLRLDLSPVAGRALAGKVGQRTVAGSLVLWSNRVSMKDIQVAMKSKSKSISRSRKLFVQNRVAQNRGKFSIIATTVSRGKSCCSIVLSNSGLRGRRNRLRPYIWLLLTPATTSRRYLLR